jgi:hypothetical protein
MKRLFALSASLVLSCAMFAADRQTIHVRPMEGMESIVESALRAVELPFDFIEDANPATLRAGLTRMQSPYGELLYKHKLGRHETHRLELRSSRTNKVIASHNFALAGGESSRKEAAEEFARKVKRAWLKAQS